MSMDISSVVSKAITVLSKRINKPGKGKRAGGMGSGSKRAPGEHENRRGLIFYFWRGVCVQHHVKAG